MFSLPKVAFDLIKCRAFASALTVLIFCFANSASASEEGQKSHSHLSSTSKGSRAVQLKRGAAVVGPNLQIHPNPATQQFEVSITTNPSNPDIVLAAWNAMDTALSLVRLGWSYTSDGGVTWTGRDTLPTHLDPATQPMADPGVGVNSDGDFFVSGLYRVPDQDLFVARSLDTGVTWSQTTFPFPDICDKPHMAIDINAGSPFQGYIYTAYSAFGIGSPARVRFQRSTNKGQNFSTPLEISGSITGTVHALGANLAVSPDSELYATWFAFSTGIEGTGTVNLGFNESSNGGISWGTAKSILTTANIGILTKPRSTGNS